MNTTTRRGPGRPAGATALRRAQAEIGQDLDRILIETADADLRPRLTRYARWLQQPVGERPTDWQGQ